MKMKTSSSDCRSLTKNLIFQRIFVHNLQRFFGNNAPVRIFHFLIWQITERNWMVENDIETSKNKNCVRFEEKNVSKYFIEPRQDIMDICFDAPAATHPHTFHENDAHILTVEYYRFVRNLRNKLSTLCPPASIDPDWNWFWKTYKILFQFKFN